MNVNYESMVAWEQQKAVYLQQTALNLDMDLDGHGDIGVNRSSGYTYLWMEEYSFVLYMPIYCELQPSDVWVMYMDSETGEEFEDTLDSIGDTHHALDAWVDKIIEEVA